MKEVKSSVIIGIIVLIFGLVFHLQGQSVIRTRVIFHVFESRLDYLWHSNCNSRDHHSYGGN